MCVDDENHHLWKTTRIGQIMANGFNVIWATEAIIHPVPFPPTRTISQWLALGNDLSEKWHGPAAPPMSAASPSPAQSHPDGDGRQRMSTYLEGATIYAVLLALAVIIVWQAFTDTRFTVAEEASAVGDRERMSWGFRPPSSAQLHERCAHLCACRGGERVAVDGTRPIEPTGERSPDRGVAHLRRHAGTQPVKRSIQ